MYFAVFSGVEYAFAIFTLLGFSSIGILGFLLFLEEVQEQVIRHRVHVLLEANTIDSLIRLIEDFDLLRLKANEDHIDSREGSRSEDRVTVFSRIVVHDPIITQLLEMCYFFSSFFGSSFSAFLPKIAS